MDILDGLNPAQRRAVEVTSGPLLIIAGPGSGKTRVITHRIAYLVRVCGISPRHIMAVTFTNKAAKEMKDRLETLLGQVSQSLTVGTFHAICAGILRQDGSAIGLNPRFVIHDEDDQLNLIKQSLQELDLDPKQFSPRAIQSAIKYAKSRLLTPADYAKQVSNYYEEIVQRVYERYQQSLGQSHGVDFDDLLMKTVQLFTERKDVLSRYQSRYKHILVDEFQDTNLTQYMLVKQLGEKHRNICVVGDPDQSIYSWRFADLRNILSFEKDHPDATVAYLEQNYRSTKIILDVASSVISANFQRKPKRLWTENETGIPVTIIEALHEEDEARFIAKEIEKLAGENITKFSGCAVMYRVNAQSRALEETFIRYGIPYKLVGGIRFYQRQEIKDVIAYLRVIYNQNDNISLARIINVPARGIGQRTLAEISVRAKKEDIPLYTTLKKAAQRDGIVLTPRSSYAVSCFVNLIEELTAQSHGLGLSALIDELLRKTGYREYVYEQENGEERWENIMELIAVAKEYDSLEPPDGLARFLEKVSLVQDTDDLDERANAVTLITLHQAKGLEFPVVFITGMEEGLLPHRKSAGPDDIEEERRLCYVGITRAQKRAYLSYALQRSFFGSSSRTTPSRFLRDIPAELTIRKTSWQEEEDVFTPVTSIYSARPAKPANFAKFEIGDRIYHRLFGDGVVIDCSTSGDDQEITVAFTTAGIKKLLVSLAPIEKL